jgi:hypothetical protein
MMRNREPILNGKSASNLHHDFQAGSIVLETRTRSRFDFANVLPPLDIVTPFPPIIVYCFAWGISRINSQMVPPSILSFLPPIAFWSWFFPSLSLSLSVVVLFFVICQFIFIIQHSYAPADGSSSHPTRIDEPGLA